jgi:hypothetical protein
LGLKRRGPIWRWTPDDLRGRASEWALDPGAGPQTVSAPRRPGRGALAFCFFLSGQQRSDLAALVDLASNIFFTDIDRIYVGRICSLEIDSNLSLFFLEV